jgi:hypothetical protein
MFTWEVTGSEKMRLTSGGDLLLGGHSAYTYDDTGASNVILDIYGGATAGKRGILSLSGRVGTDNGDIGTIWFNNDNNSGSGPGNTMKLSAVIQAKITTSDGNAGSDAGAYMQFMTKPEGGSVTERMRISGNGQFATHMSSTNGLILGSQGSAGTTYTLIKGKNTSTGINTGNDSFYVYSNGNVQNTNNSYGQISDVKLKENIVGANSQWDDIKAIQVRNFNFKEETNNPTHTQIGVVAQEIETVSPGLVYEIPDRDDEGVDLGTVTKGVNYSVLYMKAVKALQEAQTRIETLETQHADLLARVTTLEGS